MVRPHCLLAAAAAAVLVLSPARAELRLEAQLAGRSVPVAGVARHALTAAAGATPAPLPPGTPLRLVGDLRSAAAEVLWSPQSTVERVDRPDRERARDRTPFRADIWIAHEPGVRPDLPDDFLRAWPAGTRRPAILVFAWVVDGRPTQVWAHPIPATRHGRTFLLDHTFKLSAAAARGEPVALLWADGRFVPPAPRFADARAEAALQAVAFDDADALRAALAGGLKPAVRDRRGVPLLQYAVDAGAERCVDALLAAGASANDHGPGATPLSLAAADGRAAIVARLLAAKARPDEGGISALQAAIDGNHEDIAVTLIRAGANRDAVNHLNEIPAAAAINAGMARAAALLLAGFSADLHGDQTGLSRVAAEMLDHPTVDLHSEQTIRVLETQAKLGHTAMVQLLLQHHVRQDHAAALIAGAVSGDPAIAQALIARGARPDDRDANGLTALMVAATHDRAQYAAALLAAGAHPNLTTPKGATALHLAASANAAKVARVLIAGGADVNQRIGHSTALDLALAVDARQTAAVLADAGARVDLHAPAATVELERAIDYDLAPLVSAALADGWSPNTAFDGWPALALARAYGSTHCAAVLEHAGARLDASAPRPANPKDLDRGVQPAALVRPQDPRTARDHFPAAQVELETIVDRDGTPRFVRLVKTSDFTLVKPAIDAVERWRFRPATVRHRPVPLVVQLPLEFASSRSLWPDAADVDVVPRVVRQAPPVYPDDLRDRGIVGTVMLRFLVTPDGHTTRIRVLSTSHPELAQAAVEAAAQWTFKPGQLDGHPVAAWMQVPIVFALH